MELILQNARLSYADGLFTARAQEEGQTAKYGVDFIIEKQTKIYAVAADGKRTPITLHDAEEAVAKDTFKDKWKQVLTTLESSKKAIRSGDTKDAKSKSGAPEYVGKQYVSAKRKTAPPLFDNQVDPATGKVREFTSGEEATARKRFYTGAYVNAKVSLYGMSDPLKRGIFCSIEGVAYSGKGEAFGGGERDAKPEDFVDLTTLDNDDGGSLG